MWEVDGSWEMNPFIREDQTLAAGRQMSQDNDPV
jgi:hypothetical protein